jgi:hypothetical protein
LRNPHESMRQYHHFLRATETNPFRTKLLADTIRAVISGYSLTGAKHALTPTLKQNHLSQ